MHVSVSGKLGVAPVPDLAVQQDSVLVSGAGHSSINGVYDHVGTYLDRAYWCLSPAGSPSPVCGWPDGTGSGLTYWTGSDWHWGIGQGGHHRYYTASSCNGDSPFAADGTLASGCTILARSGYGATPIPSVLSKKSIWVTGAGYAEANGLYIYAGTYLDRPYWCLDRGGSPSPVCGWPAGTGCGLTYWEGSDWHWGIGCGGHHRYYTASICNGESPFDSGCTILTRSSYGTAPAPKISWAD